jgi:16S rRNA (adenine1518-N6/adenine1519-N6)-dimethyltransferase
MSAAPRAKKSLGQNFLIDPNQQRRIVAAVGAEPGDTVVEIGPGRGALTRHLIGRTRRLILVELDDELAAALRHEYAGRPDVEVLHGDFLRLDLRVIVADPHDLVVVGNIPYNITSPIIFRLLEPAIRPRRSVLMIQKEVADRILAPPGTGEYGALSVGVRSVARVERMFQVGRGSFRPVPRVDSTVIRIEPIAPAPLTPDEETDLRSLTRTAFSWRRKQLQKTLRAAPQYMVPASALDALERATGISLATRPEQLDPGQFIDLSRALRRLGRPGDTTDAGAQ